MPLIEDLRVLAGTDGVLERAQVAERIAGMNSPYPMRAQTLVRPKSTQELSAVMRYCNKHRLAVVTQGGMTGLVRGGDCDEDSVVISLERMRAIEAINIDERTATVQAGVVLQTLQEEVDARGLLFPLDLGARGSATVGGNASTNAGGNRVIRYGMMRDMILGMEVVLADGTVLSSMNRLIKNNTGYDLKQLFIGAEGTLGIITRLVLRLREKPASKQVAMVALPEFEAMPKLLKHMDRSLGGTLSAFEAMWQPFYQLVTTPPAKGRPPVPQNFPFYALIESLGSHQQSDSERFNAALEAAINDGLIADAAIAQSDADCQAIWALRDDVQQLRVTGRPVTFDISLPVGEMKVFTETLTAQLPAAVGEHQLWIFGHLGDGNLHVIVQVHPDRYVTCKPVIEALVYEGLRDFKGSVSAEHGIGLEKKAWLSISRNESELEVMRMIKKALDPNNILNPGKIL